MAEISRWAERYIKKYGFHLVPIEPNRKFPREKNWGENTLNNPMHASAFYESRSDWNVGVALAPSRVCSLDIDHFEWFSLICEAFNIDLKQFMADYPTIHGRGYRIMFRVPNGIDLPYIKMNWHVEEDPKGEKYRELMKQAREFKAQGDLEREAEYRELAKPYAMRTVFELRSACDGSQKQDLLPPSIHPETGKPYEWHTPPANEIPEPPAWLLAVWMNFDSFRKQFMAACPWADIDDIYQAEKAKPIRPREYSSDGGLILAANTYAERTPIDSELKSQGYKRIFKNRYLSPYSSTGLPGVAVFSDSNKCWIHHASDPLCSDSSGQPVSSFDLYCEYVHGGDFVRAAKKCAEMFGMRNDAPSYNEPQARIGSEMLSAEYLPADNSNAPIANTKSHSAASFDYVTPLPWVTPDKRMKPLKMHENLAEILKRLNVEIRYNVMRKEEELIIPNTSFSVDNAANASLAWLDSMCALCNYPTDKNTDFLTLLADQNHYSPVVEWVSSREWDGVDRLTALCDTVTATTPKELKRTLIKRWLISAIAAAFSPNGVSAQGVLVFQGTQNIGKTTWLERLVPKDINRKYRMVQTGVLLRPDDKDSVKQACSSWLVELGEIDGITRKADEAQLKAFITRNEDTMRRPYAKKESTFPRRTVFFGSVNPREYLKDDTGNRRFWTIECQALNSQHDICMQQLWAQIHTMWASGENHWLTNEELELLNSMNEDYKVLDPVEELILSGLDWEISQSLWKWATVTDTLLEVGIDRPTRTDTTKAGAIISKLNNDQRKRIGGMRLTLVPPRKIFS